MDIDNIPCQHCKLVVKLMIYAVLLFASKKHGFILPFFAGNIENPVWIWAGVKRRIQWQPYCMIFFSAS